MSTSQFDHQSYLACRELHGQRNFDSPRVDVSPLLAVSGPVTDEFAYFVACVQELLCLNPFSSWVVGFYFVPLQNAKYKGACSAL